MDTEETQWNLWKKKERVVDSCIAGDHNAGIQTGYNMQWRTKKKLTKHVQHKNHRLRISNSTNHLEDKSILLTPNLHPRFLRCKIYKKKMFASDTNSQR